MFSLAHLGLEKAEGPRILACHPVLVDGFGTATQNPHTALEEPGRPPCPPAGAQAGWDVAWPPCARAACADAWAEVPVEPLPPQTTDVDRDLACPRPASDRLAGPGWSWGWAQEGPRSRPRPGPRGVSTARPGRLLLALASWLLLPPCLSSGSSVTPWSPGGTTLSLSPCRVPAARSGRPVPGPGGIP